MLTESLHLFVNIFAGGRSEVKIYLFFAYIIGICTLYSICIFSKKNKVYSVLQLQGYIRNIAYAGLIIFTLGLTSHFFLLHKIGVHPLDTIVIFNNDEISSTVLSHIHTMKGSMAVILELFNKNNTYEGVDAGGAFIGLLPNSLFILGVILLVFILLYIIKTFIALLTLYPEKKKFLFAFSYGIFTFSILKNVIDGGFFNKETIPSILAFYILISNPEKKSVQFSFTILLITTVALFSYEIASPGNLTLLPANILAISSLATLLTYFTVFGKNSFNKIFILIICISSIYLATKNNRGLLSYLQLQIPPNTKIFIQSRKNIEYPNLELLLQIGDMRYYTTTVPSKTSILSIVDIVGSPKNFRPVSAPGITCNMYNPYQQDTVDVYVKEPISEAILSTMKSTRSTLVEVTNIYPLDKIRPESYYVYRMHVSRFPCASRKIETVQQILFSYGFNHFIISNPD